MKTYFDHEKLDVYREAIDFCGWVGQFLSGIPGKLAAKDQLDRASTSIPLNIAEGNGNFPARIAGAFLRSRAVPSWSVPRASTSWWCENLPLMRMLRRAKSSWQG